MLTLSSLATWHFVSPTTLTSPTLEPITLPPEYANRNDLVRCSLTSLEQEFARNFPGLIETYRHDRGTVIFRYINGATRKLHDSSICLKSSGFKLSAPLTKTDSKGRHWKVYIARNTKNNVQVRSTVIEVGTNNSWDDVEEWFWHSFFTNSNRGYLAITEINDVVDEGGFY